MVVSKVNLKIDGKRTTSIFKKEVLTTGIENTKKRNKKSLMIGFSQPIYPQAACFYLWKAKELRKKIGLKIS